MKIRLSWVCGSINHCWLCTSPTPRTSPKVTLSVTTLCHFAEEHSAQLAWHAQSHWWRCVRKSFPSSKKLHTWITNFFLFFVAFFTKETCLSKYLKIIRKYQPKDFYGQGNSPLIKVPDDQKIWDVHWFRAYVPQGKKRGVKVNFVIKVPLIEHMLAQTNILARHNLAIKRKLLDVKATCPRGSNGTGLKGT